MLLAGGRGTRLNILGAHRAKPAVPFGGLYRIIDFALSNCMYGRLLKVGVLTQYRPISLLNHVADGTHWDMAGKTGVLKNLPPYQARDDFDWYHGTADAVYQNLNFIRRYQPERVLILSGDHIYRMDYRKMLDFHREKGADLTMAAMPVPMEETHRFGIIVADSQNNVVEFQEKPEHAKGNLASMGVYVFETGPLVQELVRMAGGGGTDFGKHVIPAMLGSYRMVTYPFDGYWRDVGTIDSYFSASQDVLDPGSGIDLFDWRARTNLAYEGVISMPPARVLSGAKVRNSLVSPGCVIAGTVDHCVLSPGVVVEKDAVVSESIIMHRSTVKRGAVLERTIVDKHCVIGAGARLVGSPGAVPNRLTPSHLASGLVVVGRNSVAPPDTRVGGNTIVHPSVREGDYQTADIGEGETVVKSSPA